MPERTTQAQLAAARQALGLVRLAANGAPEAAMIRRFRQTDDHELVGVATAQLAAIVGRAIARAAGLPPDALDRLIVQLDVACADDEIIFVTRTDPAMN
jgi:hypothetical protein